MSGAVAVSGRSGHGLHADRRRRRPRCVIRDVICTPSASLMRCCHGSRDRVDAADLASEEMMRITDFSGCWQGHS